MKGLVVEDLGIGLVEGDRSAGREKVLGVQIYVEHWGDDLAKLTRPQMSNFLSK